MPTGANRNVILSHGGKHGRAAGTYLKSTVVPATAAPHVPNRLLTEVVGKNPGQHGSKPADSTKAKAVQTPAKAKPKAKTPANVPAHRVVTTPEPSPQPPAEAPKAAEAPTPVTVPKAEQAPPEAPQQPDLLEAPETPTEADPLAPADEPEPAAEEVQMPTSKRQLARMAKADAYALAVELGLDVPTNPDDIRSSDLKDILASEIGL